MPSPDQSAARVHRDPAADLQVAGLDRLPALAGRGDAEVVDRGVLAHREAVVRLDEVEVVDPADARAAERVADRVPDVRQHQRVVGAAGELLLQRQPDRAVAPAEHAGPRPGGDLRVVGQVVARHQHDPGGAVGHRPAVGLAQPALDERVGLVVGAEAPVGERPRPGLRQRVRAGVAGVQLGDGQQVPAVDAVAPVVLVGQRAEHVRPQVLRVLPLVPDPRRRAHVAGADVTGHRLLQLDPEHQRGVVPPGLQVRHRGQRRQRPGRARTLMPGRGHTPQARLHGRGQRPEVPLPGEQLPERVAHVHDTDLVGPQVGRGQRLPHRLRRDPRDVQALPARVAREVRLVPADEPDLRRGHRRPPRWGEAFPDPTVAGRAVRRPRTSPG